MEKREFAQMVLAAFRVKLSSYHIMEFGENDLYLFKGFAFEIGSHHGGTGLGDGAAVSLEAQVREGTCRVHVHEYGDVVAA